MVIYSEDTKKSALKRGNTHSTAKIGLARPSQLRWIRVIELWKYENLDAGDRIDADCSICALLLFSIYST